MRRRTRTSNWQTASKTPTTGWARRVLSVDPSHLGLSMTSPRLFDAPMEGSNALHTQGPAPDRSYISAGHADVDGDSPVFAGRLRHGRAFDSDPAYGWARHAFNGFQLLEPIINHPRGTPKPPWRGGMPYMTRAKCSTPGMCL